MLSHQGVLHQTRSQTYNLIKFFEEKNTLQYDPRMRKSQFSMKILLTFVAALIFMFIYCFLWLEIFNWRYGFLLKTAPYFDPGKGSFFESGLHMEQAHFKKIHTNCYTLDGDEQCTEQKIIIWQIYDDNNEEGQNIFYSFSIHFSSKTYIELKDHH